MQGWLNTTGDFTKTSRSAAGINWAAPGNFNLLTVGRYVNEPIMGDEPNLIAKANADLVALRDIEVGEELTVRYATCRLTS